MEDGESPVAEGQGGGEGGDVVSPLSNLTQDSMGPEDPEAKESKESKETLMQLFCLAVDAWKPLCRLAERYVASAAAWPSHACPDTLTFMYHVRCTTVALWLWVRIWRSPIGRPRA